MEEKSEKKKIWIDILLIFIAMATSFLIRLPSISISGVSEEERSEYFSEEGAPFLKDMDSYHFLKKTKIILGEDDGNLQKFDNGLPVVTAGTFRFLNLFFEVSVEQVAGLIGPIIFMLSCIPAYIFVRRKTNRVGGFLAALLVGIMPALVVANEFLIFDTDILNSVLALTLALLFVLAIEAKTRKRRILYIIFATLVFVILGFSWHSASVYYYLFIIASIGMLVYILIREKFRLKDFFRRPEAKVIGAFLVSFSLAFFALLFSGFLKDNLKVFGANEGNNLYPESSEFVQELTVLPIVEGEKITDFFSVLKNGNMNVLGGVGLVALAILLAIYLIILGVLSVRKSDEETNKVFARKELIFSGILLVVWFLGAMVSLSKGIRFTKIATLPVCLLSGIGLGLIWEYFKESIKGKIGFLILVAVTVLPSFGAITASFVSKPSVDKALEKTANSVLDFGDDYVLATWWDTGYYFEYKGSDVLVDAGTASGGEMFWIGMAFSADDPKLSAGIFKMLSVDYLELSAPKKATEMTGGDLNKAVEMLKDILVLDREEAKKTLEEDYGFLEKDVDELLYYSHPENSRKIAVVVTEEMVDSSDGIFYYGFFNLEKGESEYDVFDFDKVNNSMLFRLYNSKENIGEFVFREKTEDKLSEFGSKIWTIE